MLNRVNYLVTYRLSNLCAKGIKNSNGKQLISDCAHFKKQNEQPLKNQGGVLLFLNPYRVNLTYDTLLIIFTIQTHD